MSTGTPLGRPSRKVSDFDWLKNQLRKITEWGEDASRMHPDEHHDYGIHTALKLAALNHALDVFTPIAHNQSKKAQRYGRSVYIDLFSGCGATRTPSGDWLAGSPLLAVHARAPFDKLILIEQAPRRFEALRDRVKAAAANRSGILELLQGNCNNLKGNVIRLLRRDDLVFICVDPEGMEIKWDTIKDIVDRCPASDLFINCTYGATRVLEEASQVGHGTQALEGFTGLTLSELRARLESGGTVLDLYERNIAEGFDRPLGAASPIQDAGGRTLYRILIRTRKTSRGSPYYRGYDDIARRLRGLEAGQAHRAIEIIKGRQSML